MDSSELRGCEFHRLLILLRLSALFGTGLGLRAYVVEKYMVPRAGLIEPSLVARMTVEPAVEQLTGCWSVSGCTRHIGACH